MQRDKFPVGVADKLKWYVYRLIDPRNGETFYVGKGRNHRVFSHARGVIPDSDDALVEKLQRIKDIRSAGLDVVHVIHRHGIDDESVAYQIEAALIDAYPGLANVVDGHDSGYGCQHVEEIIREYEAVPFAPKEPLILITIARSFEDENRSIYDAVRAAWKINPDRAATYRLVLAQRRGIVLDAFRPIGPWIPATKASFPWLEEDRPGRWGFAGEPADVETAQAYVKKRVPDRYRLKGAANPIRFIDPDS